MTEDTIETVRNDKEEVEKVERGGTAGGGDKCFPSYGGLSKDPLLELIREKDERIKDLECIIGRQDEKVEEIKEQHLRLQADLMNLKKRHRKERRNISRSVKESILLGLVNIKSNLNRAFDQVNNAKNIEALRQGLNMIGIQMEQFLRSQGVEEISGAGVEFDPNLHEAVRTEVDEGVGEATVKEVVERGYKFDDKVIVPMRAVVSVPPEDCSTDEGGRGR